MPWYKSEGRTQPWFMKIQFPIQIVATMFPIKDSACSVMEWRFQMAIIVEHQKRLTLPDWQKINIKGIPPILDLLETIRKATNKGVFVIFSRTCNFLFYKPRLCIFWTAQICPDFARYFKLLTKNYKKLLVSRTYFYLCMFSQFVWPLLAFLAKFICYLR